MDKKMMALLATNGPLTREQLSSLTGEQLSSLTREQLSWLTGGKLSWLTREQLSSLTGGLKIPKVKNPYSRMLADIEAGKRCHKQRTFGPKDANPAMNICGTPMCTAGHLVNMAGPDGYALKDRLGYAGAATLIHMKSRPDVPPQNFRNIPQEWALAYIEARAAEEVNSQR